MAWWTAYELKSAAVVVHGERHALLMSCHLSRSVWGGEIEAARRLVSVPPCCELASEVRSLYEEMEMERQWGTGMEGLVY